MKTKNTRTDTNKPDTRARLDAGRAAHASAQFARTKATKARDDAAHYASLETRLSEAEATEAFARAEAELDFATWAHRDHLLAAEVDAGDPLALAVAHARTDLEARAGEVLAAEATLAEVRRAYVGHADAARKAAGDLAERRRAAGEPAPVKPPAELAAIALEAVRARSVGHPAPVRVDAEEARRREHDTKIRRAEEAADGLRVAIVATRKEEADRQAQAVAYTAKKQHEAEQERARQVAQTAELRAKYQAEQAKVAEARAALGVPPRC